MQSSREEFERKQLDEKIENYKNNITNLMKRIYYAYSIAPDSNKSDAISKLLSLEPDPDRTQTVMSEFRSAQGLAALFEWAVEQKDPVIQRWITEIDTQNQIIKHMTTKKVDSYEKQIKDMEERIQYFEAKIQLAKDSKIIQAYFNQLDRVNAEIKKQKPEIKDIGIHDKKESILLYKKELEMKIESYKANWQEKESELNSLKQKIEILKNEMRSLGVRKTIQNNLTLSDDYKAIADQKNNSNRIQEKLENLYQESKAKTNLLIDLSEQVAKDKSSDKNELKQQINQLEGELKLTNLKIQLCGIELDIEKLNSENTKTKKGFFQDKEHVSHYEILQKEREDLIKTIAKLSEEQPSIKKIQNG